MAEPMMNCTKCGTEFHKRHTRCPNCGENGVSNLYKYVRYSEHSLAILRDKQIWFSTAESLNDPFEFGFYYSETQINGIPIDTVSFESAIHDMKQMGVLSLSEINDNILMWSHYSESHTGFCIEFERRDSNKLGIWDHCVPVIYDENLPTFKPAELTDKKTVTKILTTKSDLWAYEKEWRIIAKKGNQTYPLPGDITGIIFGCKMPVDIRREVIAVLGDAVLYKQATMSQTKFGVDITPVTPDEIKAGKQRLHLTAFVVGRLRKFARFCAIMS